ncbi:MAG TPA: nuclear transport factor 2 family protein [Candidatus Limnocylindria bacterium]|nr:nuclear transport factor 2 family protein [Candidatus Limnocylindria bacterium]
MDDERAIRRLMTRYCHLVDDGAFDELPQLWSDDAELVLRGETAKGPAAITAMIAALQTPERRGIHMGVNAIIDVDGDMAQALSDFVFIRREGGPDPIVKFVGRYADRFVRTRDGWRIRRREIHFRFGS